MSGKCPMSHHGSTSGRGCSHATLGSFGKLFPDLEPAYFSDEAIVALGAADGLMHDRRNSTGDSNIPAAYTFFAQLVDHDITLDVASQLNSTKVQDPSKIGNLRSMTLDLDCVYGFGPEASPYLYEDDKLVVGNPKNKCDLRRVIATDKSGKVETVGRALIGDPRNDENLFVSQLQFAFHLLHNKLLEEGCGNFEEAQRQARYHYQHIVLNDFLARVCDAEVYRFACEKIYRHEFPLVYRPNDCGELEMPVEFSVAAYRFGHTLVRKKYQPNSKTRSIEIFQGMSNGFEFVKPSLTVEWVHLFEKGPLSKSKRIDEKLVDELIQLPDNVVGDEASDLERSLAFRNLVRGRSLGLPSGRQIARALVDAGYPIDSDIDLKLNSILGWSKLSACVRNELQESLPLFFFLLKESDVANKGMRLGPTASAILMEVFGGILLHCNNSFLNENWSPSDSVAGFNSDLTLCDILKFVDVYDGKPVRAAKKKSKGRRKRNA